MPEVLAWILGLLAFLVVLAISIGLHEGGHMGVAKLFKLSVPKFFVGFGPTIWSKKTAKTEYGFKAIPLGGFVSIEDERQPEDSHERGLLSHVTPWKRILVFLAGPAVNLVLGTVILASLLMTMAIQTPTTQIDTTDTCSIAAEKGGSCTAAEAGLLSGDIVKKIDGQPVKISSDFSVLLDGKDSVVLEIDRNGELLTIDADLENEKLGINLAIEEEYRTFGEAFATIGDIFVLNVESLAELPSKVPGVIASIFGAERDPEAPSSIISVGKTYGDVSANAEIEPMDKFQMLMMYSGLLNIGLGLINLLPVLPLDGGRVLIALMDTVKMAWSKLLRRKYSPVGVRSVAVMTAVAGAAVFSFMALLMISDIVQISRGAL